METREGWKRAKMETRETETMSQNSHKGNILVVDDQPADMKLMEDLLRREGYDVRSVAGGRLALLAASQQPPDLILLDIHMPEMNGFEVCERLKSDASLGSIPVIFLSALSEKHDKVRGFRAGGVDYITKPFEFEEVYARVATHLRLHFLQSELQQHTNHLEDLVTSRTSELAETQARLRVLDRAKSDFLTLISHEFNTPLNGLLGISELFLAKLDSGKENDELRELFDQSRQRILTILEDALLLTQIDVEGEKLASTPVAFGPILSLAIARAMEFANSHRVRIEAAVPDLGIIRGEQDLLVKALQALLETAVKFSMGGEPVQVTSEYCNDELICVAIRSHGRTIPADAISRLFDLFSIAEAITPGGDLGLDLPVAHRILVLFGGSITVANRKPPGIEILVKLRRVRS
jgi:two-component system sensor histidine kinase/response regulator